MVGGAGRAARYGVIAKHAALKLRQFRGGVYLTCAYFPRAREAGADTPSSVSRPTRDQSDPLAPPGRLLADVAYASAIGLCKDSIIMQSTKPSNSDFWRSFNM